jgi:signal transduction histidine kinase
MAECFGNICYAYNKKGIPDSAMLYNRKRLEIAYEIKDTTVIIESLTNFAIFNAKKHHYREALNYYEEALMLTQLNNNISDAIHLYMNIATLYAEWGKNEQALEFARKSEQLASEYGVQIIYARILSMSGGLLAQYGLYREAIEKARKSLSAVQNTPFYYCKSLETLAMSYSELGKTDSCEFYLSKMEAYMDAGQPVNTSRFYTLKGVVLCQRNKYQEAVTVLEKAAELILTADKHTEKESVKLYQLLSEAWQKGYRNYEKALYYKQLQLNLTDSIHQKEHSEAMADFNVKYLTSEKELEISRLKLQEERLLRTRALIITGLAILAALLLVAWLYVLFLRLKKKAETVEWEKKRLQSYLEGLESERSRLAKEMHDHVSNGLLALEVKMQSSGVPAELTDMAATLQQQVREISHALIPPVFRYASLPEIIDDYVRKQNRLEGPCFQFYLAPEEGWENLPHQTALDLYRIVQEACSNVIKHACAKNVVISLSRKENLTELSIADDGLGFIITDVTQGIGLQTINERAANQNGVLSIDSSSGKGTVVQVRMFHLPNV